MPKLSESRIIGATVDGWTRTYWVTGVSQPATNLCYECCKIKPTDHFDRTRKSENGLHWYCKDCMTRCDMRVFAKVQPGQFTYLITAPAVDAVKIGKAKDPEARLRDLQVSSPLDLYLIETTTSVPERLFHSDPELNKFRMRGEWYRLCEGFVLEFKRIVSDNACDCNFSDVDYFENYL